MSARCVVCATADPAEGWNVCNPCAARIDDDLRAIVTLTHAAAQHLTPTAKPGAGGSGKPGSRPPLDVGALDDAMAADALRTLEPIERDWRNHNGFTAYGKASAQRGPTLVHHLDAMVTFLRANLALMASDTTWGGLNHQPGYACPCDACTIANTRRELARHDDNRPHNTGTRIPCPAEHPDADGRDCGWRLNFAIGTPEAVVVCPQCSTHWTTARLILVGLSDPTVTIWAYPDVVAAVVGVDSNTLRKWHERGHVDRLGTRYNVGQAYRRKRDAA